MSKKHPKRANSSDPFDGHVKLVSNFSDYDLPAWPNWLGRSANFEYRCVLDGQIFCVWIQFQLEPSEGPISNLAQPLLGIDRLLRTDDLPADQFLFLPIIHRAILGSVDKHRALKIAARTRHELPELVALFGSAFTWDSTDVIHTDPIDIETVPATFSGAVPHWPQWIRAGKQISGRVHRFATKYESQICIMTMAAIDEEADVGTHVRQQVQFGLHFSIIAPVGPNSEWQEIITSERAFLIEPTRMSDFLASFRRQLPFVLHHLHKLNDFTADMTAA